MPMYQELYTRFTSIKARFQGMPSLRKCSYYILIKRAQARGLLTREERDALLRYLRKVPIRVS